MGKDAKAAMLARIKAGLGTWAMDLPPVDEMKRRARLASPPVPGSLDDLTRALEGFGVHCHVAADEAGAKAAIVQVLRETRPSKAAVWEDEILDAVNLDGILAEEDVEAVRPGRPDAIRSGGRPCRDVADAGIGVTSADAALSFSGTLILRAAKGWERSVSLLPPVHLALVPGSRICKGTADLIPLLESWREGGAPSAVHCVTGPSSTGDIEFNIVKGMHGPVTVRVVVLTWL